MQKMKSIIFIRLRILLVALLVLTACSDNPPAFTACVSTADDSTIDSFDNVTRIHSESVGRFGSLTLPRQMLNGDTVTMNYMLHNIAAFAPKALVVLIAGGQLATNITDPDMDGVPNTASANFVVRSAHLFRNRGYKVITIDRPSDYATEIPVGESRGFAYDGYRTSMRHAVDISAVVSAENAGNLPVFIAGTSRGAISAVSNYMLAAGISLSSPVTSGSDGRPVTEESAYSEVRPSRVQVPTQVLWHVNDGCGVSTPGASQNLVGDFSDAAGYAVSGGFQDPARINDCRGLTFHGFLGIESCAVGETTTWMDDKLTTLPGSRPLASAVLKATTVNTVLPIDLAAMVGGVPPFEFKLPYNQSSLNGTLSLTGTEVMYMPPSGVSGAMDAFVYVVTDANGGTSHNVVSVTINP